MAIRHRMLLLVLLLALITIPGLLSVQPVQAQILGTNWTASFFNNTNLSGNPAATSVQYPNGINQNWATGVPLAGNGTAVPGIGADNFSARFDSTQSFGDTGTYRFTLIHNDGARLYIDGQLRIDLFNQSAGDANRTSQIEVSLVAGNHTLQVDMVEFTGTAVISAQWAFLGTSVPTSTPVPAATGQVVRVKGLALRTGPYLGASLVGVARPGTSYALQQRNTDEGLFVWYRITVGDNTGWVSGRYIEVTGNIELVPFSGTIFDQIDGTSEIGVIGTTRAIMNLRRRPSERTQLLDKIPWGAEVAVIGRTIQGGKSFWLQVKFNGKVGWIFAPFIGVRGVVDALPIR
ncbi:MAG: SH3 domain-containing protein [Armatimonadetes bacterium]|nr:SH3 domain-containing protein [Anaerolineae bacterium]